MMLNRNPYRFLLFASLTLIFIVFSCGTEKPVERVLKRLKLEYTIDTEGDYRVMIEIPDGREAQVGVSAHTTQLTDDVSIREIWSVAARIPGDLPEELAENLLGDTWSSRKFGSWALAGTTSDGRRVLVHVTRIPANSSIHVFYAALVDTAVSALDLQNALAHLEGE
jgi:hypothetical protein